MTTDSEKVEILLKVNEAPDLQAAHSFAVNKNFAGLITGLVNENYKSDYEPSDEPECFTRSPLILTSNQWLNRITPMFTIDCDLNSPKPYIADNYRATLEKYLRFGAFVKNTGCFLIKPNECDAVTLGNFLNTVLEDRAFTFVNFAVQIDLFSASNVGKSYRNDLTEDQREEEDDSWLYWNTLHKATNYNSRIQVALVINSNLPNSNVSIYRWIGDDIRMIIVPHSSFITNKSNFPLLSKRHQEIVRMFMQYSTSTVVIEPKSLLDHRIELYKDYIKHQSKFITYNEHSSGKDCPNYPLQPLHDNLDNGVYEVFERDPAKYVLYQKAIEAALVDMVSPEELETKTILLMVVGCGRGPLIRAALNASTNTKRKMKILAVEKNPNAIIVLSCLIRDLWSDKVQLISKDMRDLQLDEKVDIVVSELLGSFGDNELSPECLDGVQRLLKPDTGISIPANSISYIQPVMTKRVSNAIKSITGGVKSPNFNEKSNPEFYKSLEANWLVYFSSVFHVDETKELFTFVHPNKDVPIDNSRHAIVTFKSTVDCVLHGVAGYFTSQLYKDIEISIHPETHTQGMSSWYSAFFPIANEIQLKENDPIEVEFWRKCDEKRVWYEWRINRPEISHVHNLNGSAHTIHLL